MSGGPIQSWRDAWKPKEVTTSPARSTHAPGLSSRAYCGRNGAALTVTPDPTAVTCSDCLAALVADSSGRMTP